MDLKTDEITSIIKQQINDYDIKIKDAEIGHIIQIGDGIAIIYGLENCMYGELLTFPNNVMGIAFNLEEDCVGCVLLGQENGIKEGDVVKRTGKRVDVPVGEAMIGRVVNALGQPIDGKGEINTKKYRPIEVEAPGVFDRESVTVPLQTGIMAIDTMFPIGRGQRELIIGDRQTGKTAMAIDTIINQKGKGVICVYVAIGQKASSIAKLVTVLEKHGAMEYTVILSSTASEAASLQYIAPYAGCAIAEEFMYSGKDTLIVYDDLSKHAVAYRSMSLLLRRPPGREAYPGDVFYLHSRLLERAARLSVEKGGGSMTALPIIETLAGDVSAYIPTNVISITDGQIYLESELFFGGIRPAVNVGLSVSRVGGAAQTKAMKKVSGRLRLDLAQFRELEVFTQFSSELDKTTRKTLEQGQRIVETLKQPIYHPVPVHHQIIIIFAVTNNYLSDIQVENVKDFENKLVQFIDKFHIALSKTINTTNALDDQTIKELKTAIEEFKKSYKDKL